MECSDSNRSFEGYTAQVTLESEEEEKKKLEEM